MNARSAGGFSRRSAECLPLVVLAVLVCSAAGASCPDDTKLKQRSAGDTTGNFLSGTISWTHISGNKVRFELVSTWRRAHHWPCKQGIGFTGPDGLPGIGDHLTIVGLSPVESGQARQEKIGAVSTKLWTGEIIRAKIYRPLLIYRIQLVHLSILQRWSTTLNVCCCCYFCFFCMSRRWKVPRATARSDFVFKGRGLGNGHFIPGV